MSPDRAGNPPGSAQVIPQSLADLVERPLYADLATVRPDGTPQVNPTWFRFDGEYLWLTTTASRQKNRNWQIQPAVALSIIDPDRPSRYLEIRGRVERIIPDPGEQSTCAWLNAMAGPHGHRRMPRIASPWRSGRDT